MKKIALLFAICLAPAISALSAPAATETPAGEDAAYTKTIDKRTTDIVTALEMKNADSSNKVHGIIMAQYRALNTWHEANDPKLKELKKSAQGTNDAAMQAKAQTEELQAPLKKLHDAYLAKLSALLTPEQVEKVKDLMTYNKVRFTMNGYNTAIPDLTDAEKARIMEFLKEARELAIDGGSAEEKTAIFTKYKGKINNYLSAQGRGAKKKKPETTNAPAKP